MKVLRDYLGRFQNKINQEWKLFIMNQGACNTPSVIKITAVILCLAGFEMGCSTNSVVINLFISSLIMQPFSSHNLIAPSSPYNYVPQNLQKSSSSVRRLYSV